MSESQRYARVPAELSRAGWQRDAAHVATAGTVTGRGTSQAAALADLGGALTAMASRASLAPAFGWDAENRMLWVAVPATRDNGSTHYVIRLDADGAPTVSDSVTSDSRPARDAWQTAANIERLPSPFYRD